MPETINALASETGLTDDLVHKGLGAILDFFRQQLGGETFERIQAAIPGATEFLNRFEASAESAGAGGLLSALTGLASKLLGGGAGDLGRLLESFAKVGFTTEQIESFLPKAIAFIRSHLPADLVEQVLAKLPAIAGLAGAKAE